MTGCKDSAQICIANRTAVCVDAQAAVCLIVTLSAS